MRSFSLLVLTLYFAFSNIASDDELRHRKYLKKTNYKKKFYICPPDFIRFGYKCYYLSTHTVTWIRAYYTCQEKFGFLATIDSYTEDKSLRTLLNKQRKIRNASDGYWIGGIYNWGKMEWQWVNKNGSLTFNGFQNSTYSKSNLAWHCILMEPKIKFKWLPCNCIETHKYICQTQIKRVNRKERKLLEMKYNRTLNEIPVPDKTMAKMHNNKRRKTKDTVVGEYRKMDASQVNYVVAKRKNRKNKKLKWRSKLKHKTIMIQNDNGGNSKLMYPSFIMEEHSFI